MYETVPLKLGLTAVYITRDTDEYYETDDYEQEELW